MTEREPNASVEYVDETGRVIFADRFYDPGLDQKPPHLSYGCGRPMRDGEHYAL